MAKRKFLFYTRSLSGGGAEPVWAMLASLFADRGDEVILAIDDRGDGSTPVSQRLRIEVVGTGTGEGVRGVARLIRHFAPDVALSAISSNAVKLAAAKMISGRRTPLVFSFHGATEYRSGKLSAAAHYGMPVLNRLASRIVCVSDGLARTMIERWGSDPRKTVRIYNPVRPQQEVGSLGELLARPPHVIGLGRLMRDKGFDVLVEAFAHVATPGATLAIGGRGEDRERLQSRIAALGLAERVRLTGFVDPATIYPTARLCVIPSRSEAFGLVAAEALAAGLPLVVTDCDGPREIVQGGRFGRVVPVEDAVAMARAIDEALADPGDPAPRIERAKAFSVEAGFAAWSGLLDAVMRER